MNVSSTFRNILEHTCIPVSSWKKSKKKHTETFTVVFFVSTFFHKILPISTIFTFFHVKIGKILWKNVEICKILWKNVENKKTTVKVSLALLASLHVTKIKIILTRQWRIVDKAKHYWISNTRVKSTKLGLKETEESKACTRIIRKKLYESFHFLQSYNVN